MKKKPRQRGIPYAEIPAGEQIFHWRSFDCQDDFVIAVDQLRKWLIETQRVPVTSIALYPELMAHIAEHHGVEKDRLEKMHLSATSEPAIFLHEPGDGSHICCDGNHRLLRRYSVGLLDAPAHLVPRPIWCRFVILDLPEVTKEQHDAWVYGGSRFESPFQYPRKAK